MARKTRGLLPSGNIRVQVYDYTDDNGKRHYKSFTARTKSEAQALAAEWRADKKLAGSRKTILDAVRGFVEINEPRLSPTTYKTYKGYIRYFQEHRIGLVRLSDLTNSDVQRFVNELSLEVSPKTVKNVYLVLKPAVELERDDFRFKVVLPEIRKQEKYIPTLDDVRTVLDSCPTQEMRVAIMLGLYMLRRGEACALTFDDIDFRKHQIRIDKSLALTEDNTFILKGTKTRSSERTIPISDAMIGEIRALGRKNGSILNMTPSLLTNRFETVVKRSGVPYFNYHTLRHVGESLASTIMPSAYIEDFGGWERGSDVRVRHYDHTIDTEKEKYNAAYLDRLDDIWGNDCTNATRIS